MKKEENSRFLLHAHSNLYTISIDFKRSMIKEYLTEQLQLAEEQIEKIFHDAHQFIAGKLAKLADEIINYKLTSVGSELFYEVKAREWLSIIINEYYNHQNKKPLSEADDLALISVSTYINDHFASDIPQELLAKIAMMSKTKLKNSFKLKYHMTLTEFIQRRRMNMAEQLLGTTQLDIKDVAKSVGYQSHSRFSTLFKKYMGLYPHQVRKQEFLNLDSCPTCSHLADGLKQKR